MRFVFMFYTHEILVVISPLLHRWVVRQFARIWLAKRTLTLANRGTRARIITMKSWVVEE